MYMLAHRSQWLDLAWYIIEIQFLFRSNTLAPNTSIHLVCLKTGANLMVYHHVPHFNSNIFGILATFRHHTQNTMLSHDIPSVFSLCLKLSRYISFFALTHHWIPSLVGVIPPAIYPHFGASMRSRSKRRRHGSDSCSRSDSRDRRVQEGSSSSRRSKSSKLGWPKWYRIYMLIYC